MFPRIILILLGLAAQALGLPADQADPTLWSNLAIATLVVWGATEYARMYVFKGLQGGGVHLLAGSVGVLLGVLLGIAGVVTGEVVDWIVFGIQATFYATLVDVAGKTVGKTLAKRPA